MSHIHASTSPLHLTAQPAAGFLSCFDSAITFIDALFNAGPLIKEVEAMGKLLKQAHQVEASDPEHAASLRRKAARMVR